MKHIAILSTMYYPDMGAPSACIDKYIKALKHKYTFHIITRTNVIDFKPSNEYDIRYISSLRHRLILKCRHNIDNNIHVMWSRILLSVINLGKLVQTQYSFPSAQRWEIIEYKRKLEELSKEYSLDAIISVSNTVFTQLAVLEFKKKKSDTKWISFCYDPYSENYIYYKYKLFKSFWKKMNYTKEQEIYDSVDFCLFTSELYKFIPNTFTIDRNKIFELLFPLNFVQKSEYNKNCSIEHQTDCKLLFAGMFYKLIRNPEYVLSILAKVPNIQFDMFVGRGECEDIIKRYTQQNFHRYEYVNYDRYIEMIYNEYDILINVGNVSTLQAPSKMLELLSTGKPILNFYFSKDSQYEMIERYPLGMNIGHHEKDAVKKVEKFCKMMKGQRMEYKEVEKLFPNNNLQKQVELLQNLIEK